MSIAQLKRQMADQGWRLNNLYWIHDKEGKRRPFKMNWAQQELFEQIWFRNIALKVRQIGISTFWDLLMLDTCVFNDGMSCGVIAHDRDSAEELFRRNIKEPYESLPQALRKARPAERESSKQLIWPNGSSIRVSTSLRSGTLQMLHISEFGKICARYPEKSREVVTGSLEAVSQDGVVLIESTAEGREGYFHDYTQLARESIDAKRKLHRADYRFFFFPWWKHPSYRMQSSESKATMISAERMKYFDDLQKQIGIEIDMEQRAWYIAKASNLGEDMMREYPSTPDEAFFESIRGAYYGDLIKEARQEERITNVKYSPGVAVETWWDLGMDDSMSIWFVQQVGQEIHAIDYYENSGEGLAHYAKVLQDKEYVYGRHYAPHDIRVRELGGGNGLGTSRWETALGLGIRFEVGKNNPVIDGIESVRNILPHVWFDAEKCDEGIKGLENYRKEWNEQRGCYRDKPVHNWASHPSDSFRTGVMGRSSMVTVKVKPVQKRSARGWT